jgi:hypothetical protein
MALGPGTRRDIYYIAVAGSSDTVGQVVCEASADLTLTEIDGFARTERVMLRVAWGEDTCGLDLLGVVYYQVYAWVDTSATLHMWMPSAEYPEDMPTPPDEDDDEIASAFKLCDAPTITLTGGDTTTGHPAGVCDPEVLFGPGNYRLSNTPGW